MRNIYRSFLVLIAGATQKELLRHNRFLMIQSQAMRKKLPLRIEFSAQERRRLCAFATPLGGVLDHLVTIVHPDTMRRWIREERKSGKLIATKRGRKRTAEQIRKLILKLAKGSDWGYTRILGELKKLGIMSVCAIRSKTS